MSNPFSTTAPQARTVPAETPVVNQVAEAAVAPVAPAMPAAAVVPGAPVAPGGVADAAAVVKKDRKKPNRQMSVEERRYVLENYATKNTSEMAVEMGLTRQQVYGTVRKGRESILAKIAAANTAGDVATATKLQLFLDTKLPEKPFGGGGSGATRGSSIDSAVDSLLAGLV